MKIHRHSERLMVDGDASSKNGILPGASSLIGQEGAHAVWELEQVCSLAASRLLLLRCATLSIDLQTSLRTRFWSLLSEMIVRSNRIRNNSDLRWLAGPLNRAEFPQKNQDRLPLKVKGQLQ
jgi:hypothetical protein